MQLELKNNYYYPSQKYKVLVLTYTYNQSTLIKDTLSGFINQQLQYPFVCLIIDDCSTDGEQEVLKSWMISECNMEKSVFVDLPTAQVYIANHKNNLSCTFAFYLLKQNMYRNPEKENYINPWREKSEYEAWCEGDDFWTDPLKLKKQVDLLSINPNMSFCHTAFSVLYDNNKTIEVGPNVTNFPTNDKKTIIEKIIDHNKYRIQTNTVLVRQASLKSLYEEDPFLYCSGHFLMGDTQLWVGLLYRGDVGYIDDSTSVYRVIKNSVSQQTTKLSYIKFLFSSAEMRLYLIDKYKLSASLRKTVNKEYQLLLVRYLIRDKSIVPLYPLQKRYKMLFGVIKIIYRIKHFCI